MPYSNTKPLDVVVPDQLSNMKYDILLEDKFTAHVTASSLVDKLLTLHKEILSIAGEFKTSSTTKL